MPRPAKERPSAPQPIRRKFGPLPDWAWPFIVGLALRVILPWFSHGFRYMDEHYQVIEPANHLVNDIWTKTYDWDVGHRSWIYPWLVSLPMRLIEFIGVSNPIWINSFIRSCHGLFSATAIPIAFLATAKLSSKRAARWTTWFIALWPYALFSGFHTHGEMLGAWFILTALALPVLMRSKPWAYVLSGACFGIAIVLKVDVGVAGLGFGLWQLMHGRLRQAFLLALGVLPPIFVLGFVDELTWGRWFNSLIVHFDLNINGGIHNMPGVEGWWDTAPWYVMISYYLSTVGAPIALAIWTAYYAFRSHLPTKTKAQALAARMRIPEPLKAIWFTNVFFVVVFMLVPHKEKRFLAPVLYTSILGAFALVDYLPTKLAPKVWGAINPTNWLRARFPIKAWVLGLAVLFWVAILAQTAIDAEVYLLRRPWWDRIQLMHNVANIPGVQKIITPEWSAAFFMPKNIPWAAGHGDMNQFLRNETANVSNFAILTESDDMTVFSTFGFHCDPWPSPRPPHEQWPSWVYFCVKRP